MTVDHDLALVDSTEVVLGAGGSRRPRASQPASWYRHQWVCSSCPDQTTLGFHVSGSCCSWSCTAHVPVSPVCADAGRSKPRHSTWGAPYLLPELGELLLDASCFAAGLYLNRHRPPPRVHGGQQALRIARTCNCIRPKLYFPATPTRNCPQPSRWPASALPCPSRARARLGRLGVCLHPESRPSDRQSEPVPTWSEPASGRRPRPSRTPVASPAQASRRAAIADRTPAITGRAISGGIAATLPHAQPSKACAAGPGGFLGSAPALANNDQSFILGRVEQSQQRRRSQECMGWNGDFRVDSATPADQNLLTEGRARAESGDKATRCAPRSAWLKSSLNRPRNCVTPCLPVMRCLAAAGR